MAHLLLETGDDLLTEGGDFLLLEVSGATAVLDDIVIDVEVPDPATVLDDIVIDVEVPDLLDATPTVPTWDPGSGDPTDPAAPGDPYVPASAPVWVLEVAQMDGTVVASTSNLDRRTVGWAEVLNGVDEATAEVSFDDPCWDAVRFIGETTEARLRLDGDIKAWGPVRQGSLDIDRRTAKLTIGAASDYLGHRIIGRAQRLNLLTNGGFETGTFTGWTTSGANCTIQSTSPVSDEGTYWARIGATSYLTQSAVVTHTFPAGLVVRATFSRYVPVGGNSPTGNIGARISATDTSTGISYPGTVIVIDDDSSRGRWVSAYMQVLLSKPNVPYNVLSLLRGAQGGGGNWIGWDSGQLSFNDALTVDPEGEDVAVAARKLLEHAQDVGYGKDDVNLIGDFTDTGTVRLLSWPHSDHRTVLDAYTELVRAGYLEWWVTYSETTRILHVAPTRGSEHPEWAIELGGRLGGGRFTVDGDARRTSLVYGGDQSNFARQEAGARDATLVALEEYRQAPVGSTYRQMQDMAASELAHLKGLPVIPDVVILDPSREMVHGAHPGDIVDVTVAVNNTSLDGVIPCRITTKRVGATADRLVCTLAPVP